MVRRKEELAFRIIKCQFSYKKTVYLRLKIESTILYVRCSLTQICMHFPLLNQNSPQSDTALSSFFQEKVQDYRQIMM